TYRKQPGNSTGFSKAVVPTGEFILAGHSMQRTAIYVYEKPNNMTITTPESEWKYDEIGPDNNPDYLPDGVNKKHRFSVSGQVWWETSTSDTTYPISAGESFVNQSLEEAKTGFRIITSVLTSEGKQALSATNGIPDVNERIRAQQEILKNNPAYIQQTVVAPIVGKLGRYTARLDEKFDTDYMYQQVVDGDGDRDVTDPDDGNDGYTDEEEIDAGTDPKDPDSHPSDEDIDNGNPVITPIEA